ncbi:hypothetical protein B7P43_G16719 [Cryptotermes secundus]|uniref:PiggyBac transposable element-derived protein domain-containing protein n=1 Tax=Cryptotermes secundus TaxID=105785 RepID=A0A2J7RD01_9NEOP|nr:hypothetical protein B7P43_G16719 [Cryptotermes secundus]
MNNYSGAAVGLNINEAPHVNKDSTPFCVSILYFAWIIRLLVEETNRYYHQHLDKLQDGLSPRPDVTDSQMFLFLGIIIQMGHDIRDRLKDYWSTAEQFATPFYSNTMKRDRFLHILCFHFVDNNTKTDRNADSYDRLWKIRTIFDVDRMANSYSISCRTWKWTNKLFFHFLDMTILNSFILLSSCGTKLSHREFRLAPVCNMLEHAARGPPRPQQSMGRPPAVISDISIREGLSTSLADFLYFEIEMACVLFA